MQLPIRQPYVGHALILAVLVASVGVTRAVFVDPRSRETASLRAETTRLEGELADLQRGLVAMEEWQRAHPGEDASRYTARRALKAREMVPTFLREVTPIADRWKVETELIQPAGTLTDVVTTDAAGRTETYRRADLRFRLMAPYRELGEYLGEVEAMDQLVVVRSVAIRYEAALAPKLVADVTILLYGTP